MKNTAKAGVVMLCTPKFDVICEVCPLQDGYNSHLDRTVRLTTVTNNEPTPSYQNSCLEKIGGRYILICMLIVEIAQDDRHLNSYSSLCIIAVCTYSFLSIYIFGAQVYSFSTYVSL